MIERAPKQGSDKHGRRQRENRHPSVARILRRAPGGKERSEGPRGIHPPQPSSHFFDTLGADSFRTYLMFIGPFEEGGDFRDGGISGVKRFYDRLWASVHEVSDEGAPDPDVMRKLHQTIKKVGDDIPKLSYNTSVAAMMEYMNTMRRGERTVHRAEVEPLVQLVAPFAPHIAEELWEKLGRAKSVFDSGWPHFDAAAAVSETIQLVVQVNGKTRGTVTVPKGVAEVAALAALAAARADANIAKFITGAPKKVILVPGRLLNVVV